MPENNNFGIVIGAMNSPAAVNLVHSLDATYIYALSEDETNSLFMRIVSLIECGAEYA